MCALHPPEKKLVELSIERFPVLFVRMHKWRPVFGHVLGCPKVTCLLDEAQVMLHAVSESFPSPAGASRTGFFASADRLPRGAVHPTGDSAMHRKVWLQLCFFSLVTLAVLSISIPAQAYSGGISGYSGKSGNTCTQCHSSGTPPTVVISGPTSVASGSTNSYTLTVSGGGNGGLDVAASGGTFTAGSGTQVRNGEITHSSASSNHSWTFSWTAPTVTSNTTETVYGAAIDGYSGGTGLATLIATVTAGSGGTSLQISPSSLSFSYTLGGTTPAAQSIAVASSGAALNYTVAASGGSWLSASSGSTTPGNISVSVNPASMAAGTYNGTVTITSSGASNSPQTVPVVLTITSGGGTSLVISPSSLDFTYKMGGSVPAAQPITISSSGSALTYTATASGGSWLSTSGNSGSTPGKVAVMVNAASLTAGTYNGTVTITSSGASNSPQTVPVTLTVSSSGGGGGGSLTVHPWRLVFYSDGTEAAPQSLTVGGTSGLTFTAEAFGGSWLSLTPSGGAAPASVSVSAFAAGLPAGTYAGVVQIKGGNSTRNIEVVLVVGGHSGGGGGGGGSEGNAALQPFTFDPGATNAVTAAWQGAGSATRSDEGRVAQGLLLTKQSSAPPTSLSGALITGAAGSTLTQLGYDLRAGSECSSTAPEFVVVTNDNVVHHAGCSQGRVQAAGTTGWQSVHFDPTDAAQLSPPVAPGTTVTTVALVMDQVGSSGSAVLAHINVNGKVIENVIDND